MAIGFERKATGTSTTSFSSNSDCDSEPDSDTDRLLKVALLDYSGDEALYCVLLSIG